MRLGTVLALATRRFLALKQPRELLASDKLCECQAHLRAMVGSPGAEGLPTCDLLEEVLLIVEPMERSVGRRRSSDRKRRRRALML